MRIVILKVSQNGWIPGCFMTEDEVQEVLNTRPPVMGTIFTKVLLRI